MTQKLFVICCLYNGPDTVRFDLQVQVVGADDREQAIQQYKAYHPEQEDWSGQDVYVNEATDGAIAFRCIQYLHPDPTTLMNQRVDFFQAPVMEGIASS